MNPEPSQPETKIEYFVQVQFKGKGDWRDICSHTDVEAKKIAEESKEMPLDKEDKYRAIKRTTIIEKTIREEEY